MCERNILGDFTGTMSKMSLQVLSHTFRIDKIYDCTITYMSRLLITDSVIKSLFTLQ